MRQKDLVDALDHVIARSTLANVEVGREKPSNRLWSAIATHLPDWVEPLRPWYDAAHKLNQDPPFELSGPYEILNATYAYTFRDHRAPEEIVQVRRIRALTDGNDGYGLQLSNNSGSFDLDTESLWGGWIERHSRRVEDGENMHLTRFHFDRTLRRGQVHEFATRAWVSHDEPASTVTVMFTRPTGQVSVTLNFLGPRPTQVWSFGPLLDGQDEPPPGPPERMLTATPNGSYAIRLDGPQLARRYGIAWQW
ncbi:hypothetical protein ACTQ49_10545 [Luteococcus sp. Sow4_B9]|uniref:hypothetical protein n=1 Tax=Luteococcus sp. Sow4_B9 TaxID=3438792 RepID=UPI003F9600FB